MRHSILTCSERNESWLGQQMLSTPRSMRMRWADRAELKSDHIALTAAFSESGRFSIDCRRQPGMT